LDRLGVHFGKVVHSITSSKIVCPWPLRQLAQAVRQFSKDRDPVGTVVGFLGVHLFHPAIAFPEEYWIADDASVLGVERVRRNLGYLALLFREVVGMTEPRLDYSVPDVESMRQLHFKQLYDFFDDISTAPPLRSAQEQEAEDRLERVGDRAVFGVELDATVQVAIQQVDIEPILLVMAQHIPKIVDKLNECDAAVSDSFSFLVALAVAHFAHPQ